MDLRSRQRRTTVAYAAQPQGSDVSMHPLSPFTPLVGIMPTRMKDQWTDLMYLTSASTSTRALCTIGLSGRLKMAAFVARKRIS